MLSFLSGLLTTSWNLFSYFMMVAWYTWMCVPFVGGAYFVYRFASFYSSTSLEGYRHTKIEGEVARRSVQAVMEMVDWLASCLSTLQMVKLANTMIRLRFGISQVRQAPPPSVNRTNEIQAAMAQSIRSLGNVMASSGNGRPTIKPPSFGTAPATFGTAPATFGTAPATFGAITRDPLPSSPQSSPSNEVKTNDSHVD